MLLVLSLIPVLRQQFNGLINGKGQTNRDQNSNLFIYNNTINVEEFNSSWLKIDKKSYKDFNIYYIGYITIKKIGDCEIIYSVSSLYLIIGKVDGHIECNSIECNSIEYEKI